MSTEGRITALAVILKIFGSRNPYNIFITVFTLFVVYRQGSVITDFVLQTVEFINSEIADANEKLTAALNSIAPVIGTVTGSYNSKLSKYCPVIQFNNKKHFLHYELFV